MSEKELVEKCRKGDRTAFGKLYNIYAPYMKSVCLRYVTDEMLAEDMLHDRFIKVIESIHSFQYRGDGSLKAWMYRIFSNPEFVLMDFVMTLSVNYRTVFSLYVFEDL